MKRLVKKLKTHVPHRLAYLGLAGISVSALLGADKVTLAGLSAAAYGVLALWD